MNHIFIGVQCILYCTDGSDYFLGKFMKSENRTSIKHERQIQSPYSSDCMIIDVGLRIILPFDYVKNLL